MMSNVTPYHRELVRGQGNVILNSFQDLSAEKDKKRLADRC